jgi:heme exporter protein C
MWAWFHRLGAPQSFYRISGKWLPWLSIIALACLSVGTVWGLLYAPMDFKQGNSFRIIYIHVPAAAVSMAGYYVMAVAGAVALIWRMKLAGMVMRSCAHIGAALTFVALVTGSIWGKPTWGTWWVWDARITSMLLQLFLYLGIYALSDAFTNKDSSTRAAAVLALVGSVNIPIIYKSVDWWYSLHQPATIKLTEKSSIHPDMFWPLIIMIGGFYVLYAVLVMLHTRAEVLNREQKTKWVKALAIAGNNK